MVLTDIRTAFSTQALATTGINTFVLDDMSTANIDRNKSYPLFLMMFPSAAKQMERSDYEDWSITFYLFDLEASKTSLQILTKMSELKELCETFLYNLQVNYRATGRFNVKSKNIENGHFMHNDKLIGVKVDIVLEVFNCWTSASA